MPSTGGSRPRRKDLPAPYVRDLRQLLDSALAEKDELGRKWGAAQWGCYAFYDYDGEPIYVGQTNERLSGRVRRHLTNQRTDAVAMRVLDAFEVAEMELWPLWELEGVTNRSDPKRYQDGVRRLDAIEYAAYLKAIEDSRFKAILNEKIPPVSPRVELPLSRRFDLISVETREERGHADTRIARRAETISRLAAVTHERGEVSEGLRRVLVIQAVRLTYLSAARLAFVQGRAEPAPSTIDVANLVGNLLYEQTDPTGRTDQDNV